jgi:hypothetical protein
MQEVCIGQVSSRKLWNCVAFTGSSSAGQLWREWHRTSRQIYIVVWKYEDWGVEEIAFGGEGALYTQERLFPPPAIFRRLNLNKTKFWFSPSCLHNSPPSQTLTPLEAPLNTTYYLLPVVKRKFLRVSLCRVKDIYKFQAWTLESFVGEVLKCHLSSRISNSCFVSQDSFIIG